MQLRDYQQTGVSQIRNSFLKGFRSVLFVLPTGGGKTVIFTHIASKTIERGKRVLILVHRVELLRQTSAALTKQGVVHGLIHPKYTPNLMASVQVASVQTLVNQKRLDATIPPDLIVIDECHHATAGSWSKIMNHFSCLNLGVTATPIRSDGKGLNTMFDNMVIGPQIQELIDRGFLVKPRLFGPPKQIDFSHIDIVRGDYDQNQVVEVMDKPVITGSAIEEYTRLCPGVPAVVFCVNITHAEHVAHEFRNAGYRSYSVDGSMDDGDRSRILNGLADGSVQVVTSCDLISEGTDIPNIMCAIMLRPTKSTGLYIQQGGRALRPVYAIGFDLNTNSGRLLAIKHSNKPHCIILDHVANYRVHEPLNAQRNWSLEGEKKKNTKKAKTEVYRTMQCTECFSIFEPSPFCPVCGLSQKNETSSPDQVDGNLEEITPEQILKEKTDRKIKIAKAKTYAELKELEKEFGYKSGWARHLFHSREDKLY
jgi:superfamily II DNA or RNA helicase